MRRPWRTWLAFGGCLVVVLAAMAWVSMAALRLERQQMEAQRLAEVQERVRLSLWRMDSALIAMLTQENARPGYTYWRRYPASHPAAVLAGPLRGLEVMPSRLSSLAQLPDDAILLHFQFLPGGELTSPQVGSEGGNPDRQAADTARRRLERLGELLDADALLEAAPPAPEGPPAQPVVMMTSNTMGLRNRDNLVEQRQAALNERQFRGQLHAIDNGFNLVQVVPQELIEFDVVHGPLGAVWVGGELLLVRRVTAPGGTFLQGCWLDREGIVRALQASIADLLPSARLEPVLHSLGQANDSDPDALAALPLRLHAGPVELQLAAPAGGSIRLTLVVAWIGVLAGAAAVGGLLAGTISLSRRRAAFVSAVTHELRTPLTALRLYSDMLADSRVTDESRRGLYLEKLTGEARRLGHLVDNVLAYSRLNGGALRDAAQPATLGELLERCRGQLTDRAHRAGATLDVRCDGQAAQVAVVAVATAVEQILVNLVDNACKYGQRLRGGRVVVELKARRRRAAIRVRDFGPGIHAAVRKRLFRPFSRSAEDAAGCPPGVGLGLALSHSLARQMGGELSLVPSRDGACFELSLPLADPQ